MSATDDASQAAAHARRHPLEALGRLGYAVKGVLYVLLGALALDAALGGGRPEGEADALQALAGETFGSTLLWVLVVGLAAYGAWRIALAVLDPEHAGDDAKGWLKRAGYVISGVSYGALAYTAFRVVRRGSAGGGDGTEERTALLLGLPGGRALVGAIALGVLAYGGYQFVRAYRQAFFDKLRLEGLAARHREAVRRICQAGLAARGVVLVLAGAFLAQAAWQRDPDEAGGLAQALGTLQAQPYGAVLLGGVAFGLVMYGWYCGLNASYRRYEGQ